MFVLCHVKHSTKPILCCQPHSVERSSGYSSAKSDKNIYNEKRKLSCGEAIGIIFFFFRFFFVLFCFSFAFILYLWELSPMMSLTKKKRKRKKSNHINYNCTVSKRFGDGMEILSPNSWWTQKGRKKVNKVHEGWKVQSSEDRRWLRSWRLHSSAFFSEHVSMLKKKAVIEMNLFFLLSF